MSHIYIQQKLFNVYIMFDNFVGKLNERTNIVVNNLFLRNVWFFNMLHI